MSKNAKNKIALTKDELWQISLLIGDNMEDAIFGDEDDEENCEEQKQLYRSALKKIETHLDRLS